MSVNFLEKDKINKLKAALKSKKNTCIEAGHLFIVSEILSRLSRENKVVFFSSSNKILNYIENFFNNYKKKPCLVFYGIETLPFSDNNPDPFFIKNLIKQFNSKPQEVILFNLNLLFLNPFNINFKPLVISKKDALNYDFLIEKLVEFGYRRGETASGGGTFSVRGGIIDVFPAGGSFPVRIDFFGDNIEDIRQLDAESLMSVKKLNDFKIYSNSLLPLSKQNKKIIHNDFINNKFIIPHAHSPLHNYIYFFLSALKSGKHSPLKNFITDFLSSSLFSGRLSVIYEPLKTNNTLSLLKKEALINLNNLNCLFKHKKEITNTVNSLTINENDFNLRINSENPEVFFSARKINPEDLKPEILKNKIIYYFSKDSVIFNSFDFKTENLTHINSSIKANFIYNGVFFISKSEGSDFFRKKEETPAVLKPSRPALNVKEGDYIVHYDFGVGIYRGIKKIKRGGGLQEYFTIEYAGGDIIYVPIFNIDALFNYSGGKDPAIAKISRKAFRNLRGKIKSSLKDYVKDLLITQSIRATNKRKPYDLFEEKMRIFNKSFNFNLTCGQKDAIADINSDLKKEYPMDRLICGDVGFGKTEIAVRAAFTTVLNGKQAAVLVPTTLLCQQHFKVFSERFGGTGAKISYISRFASKKEQKKILKDIKYGKTDIIIGTHRLIQKDVAFANLGLVVIDEEQKFGVLQKEKLKSIRKTVDVLTLTATPIPRTFYAALSGVKNISNLDTPFSGKLPVKTFVRPYNKDILTEAVIRELQRDGQLFIVNNIISGLENLYSDLKKLFPELTVKIAHGQMKAKELKNTMLDFIENKTTVLISTAIIESGIDLPNVNTIIINNSHRFGLAQLYQLKGRVGRADEQGYAYFLHPESLNLTADAASRLNAVQKFYSLGSGYDIALEDLNIRGAGNLIGTEQHGFINQVGFGLYCRLLEEVGKDGLKLKQDEKEIPASNVDFDMYIPDEFCGQIEKNRIYRMLSSAAGIKNINEIREYLKDSYKNIPRELQNLLDYHYFLSGILKFNPVEINIKENTAALSFKKQFEFNGKIFKIQSYAPFSLSISFSRGLSVKERLNFIYNALIS